MDEEEMGGMVVPNPEVYIKEEYNQTERDVDDSEENCDDDEEEENGRGSGGGNNGGVGVAGVVADVLVNFDDNYGVLPFVESSYDDQAMEGEEEEEEECAGIQEPDEYVKLEDLALITREDANIEGLPMQDELTCGVCQREFSTERSLKSHLSKKHKMSIGPCFTCQLCGAIGQTKATLKRHLLRTHGRSSLTAHQLVNKCRHCNEGFPNLLDLNTHIAEAHEEVLSEYKQCTLCPGLFTTKPSLLKHISRRHPDAHPPCMDEEQCAECDLSFPTRTALRTHVKTDHPETLIHRCHVCSATFRWPNRLKRHIKKVHEKPKKQAVKVKRHKCSKCSREYRSKLNLEKHYNNEHLGPKKPKVFRCTTCGETFTTKSHKLRHLKTHWDNSRPRCNDCRCYFETQEELDVHSETHKLKCVICNKLLRRESFKEHLLIHSGPKLPCPYCGKKFTQNSNLKRHIRVHTGEKPYTCSFCDKCFSDKSACNSHMRIHTGVDRCACPVCGASFSKRQKLNYHMRKHTGEGLMHCPLCTRSATDSYTLKKHLESHQSVLGKLLQGGKVSGQEEDSQTLALRTLHNVAWVTSRLKNSDLMVALHPHLMPSGVKTEDRDRDRDRDGQDEGGKDVKVEVDDSEEVISPMEHLEIIVKVESADDTDEGLDSSGVSESGRPVRRVRKVRRKGRSGGKTDSYPTERDIQRNEIMQKCENVKVEVLSYVMNLRCAQLNDAVETCKLRTEIKEEEERKEEEDADGYETGERDARKESKPTHEIMKEPLLVLAQLWQLLIEPKEETVTRSSRRWLKEQLMAENKDCPAPPLLPCEIKTEAGEEDSEVTSEREPNEDVSMQSEDSDYEDGST